MRCTVKAAAIALGTSLSAAAVVPAAGQEATELRNPQIEIAYIESQEPAFRPIYERLKKRQVLEQLRQFLAPLKLPRRIEVRIDQCGAPFADYKPGGPVTICYEYIDHIEKLAPGGAVLLGTTWITTRDDALVGAVAITVLHETAHAVFDVFNIPVWGREDDAADKVAAFIVLQFGKETAWRAITGVAWFLKQAEEGDRTSFADIRSVMAQRFYNILCVAYGSDARTFGFLSPQASAATVYLPARRAQSCNSEYAQLKFSFEKTILPYVDRDLLQKVQATEWLK
jgi:hypothetical protein